MTRVLRLRPLWLAIGWAMLGTVVWLSLTGAPPEVVDFPLSDKVEHLLAYSLLMGWFGQIYTATRSQRGWLIGLTLMGIAIEYLQGWSGLRYFDPADMLANTLGALLGYWLTRGPLAGSLARVDQRLAHRISVGPN